MRPDGIPVLVSRCLLGEACRWDGCSKPAPAVFAALGDLEARVRWIPVCPETDGGLPTPREPCEIVPGRTAGDVLEGRGRVAARTGCDCTTPYVEGARRALEAARAAGARAALLKARSPSCSPCGVYDGRFSGRIVPGRGVTAELLARSGLAVFSEESPQALRTFIEALPEYAPKPCAPSPAPLK